MQLIQIGKYKGPICLIIDVDLIDSQELQHEFILNNNIIIQNFNKIIIPETKYKAAQFRHKVDGCSLKFNIFRDYFKQWNYIFYMDCGIHIMSDISPILECKKANKLLAHSDAYPRYQWKLHSTQFNKSYTDIYKKLETDFDLNVDYFQSTIMLFDTNIINPDTFTNILDLVYKYPIGRMNDQCYLALYFIHITPCWEQIPLRNDETYFYDYLSRNTKNKYIMLKQKK